MKLTRRDILKASAAVAGAMGLSAVGLTRVQKALGLEATAGGLPVVWLQGQSCTGCSVSLLNSRYYATIEDLLLNTLDLDYHPTVMAAAGKAAVDAAKATYDKGGYVLVVEGSIPANASGKYCTIWGTTTALAGVTDYANRAAAILAVGTCACYGGIYAGKPNPTGARGVKATLPAKTVINIPGCPVNPDWIVGTVAYIIANGKAPALDANGRPTSFFGRRVHDSCPNLADYNNKYSRRQSHARNRACLSCHTNTDGHVSTPRLLGQTGCMFALGCRGTSTYADCPSRKWNSSGVNKPGVSWCVQSGGPCIGCTEPTFPDGMSPFYQLSGRGVEDEDDERDERNNRNERDD